MYANYLLLDDEQNRQIFGSTCDSISTATDAFDKLNGERFSSLLIAKGPPGHSDDYPYTGRGMFIGGGPNEYICDVFFENDEYVAYLCNSPELSDDWISIRRGNMTQVRTSRVVDRDTVITALVEFVQTGELHSGLIWLVSQ